MEEKTDIGRRHVNLTVICDGKQETYQVRRGLGLEAIALKKGISIEFDCRKADCGICSIACRIDGFAPRRAKEEEFLMAMAALPHERLACQCRIFEDSTIEISTDW